MLQAGRSPVRVPDEVDFFNIDSTSSKNEYQESSLGVKDGWCVGLTILPLSISRISESVGASTSRNPKGLHGLHRENFTLGVYVMSWDS
jgi:hypothetical protein